MGYHDLSQSTLTNDERVAEAKQICRMLQNRMKDATDNERKFVGDMSFATSVSVKQIFFLRDILAKY